MPPMETVTIINKSGKVVSTGKHLLSIFKDAKEAYNEKKAALQLEQQQRIKAKTAQKLIQARQETQSVASSRHSRSSHRSHRHKHRDREEMEAGPSRPPLTERNLTQISEGSVTSSRRSRSSHHGSRTPRSPAHGYQAPYFENADIETRTQLTRRHTDLPTQSQLTQTPSYHTRDPNATTLSRRTQPPAYELQRSSSVPDLHHDEHIDMNLAYGQLPPDLLPRDTEDKEIELAATMSKLDALLLEAHCLQHSATAIIANLQSNPEAMAAVALTLAELSNLLTKMSPSILTALKASSPAVFALLASPQFLIAGGLAIGVTVVMFGGYKIIKKIQASAEAKKEASRVDEALVYEGDLGSIDIWRRGIAEAEAQSVSTSVDGEFITPEAARQKRERIKERAKEEREGSVHGSARSVRSERTVRRVGSESTIRRKDVLARSASQVAPSTTGRSERSSATTSKSKKVKEEVVVKEKEKKPKKSSAIAAVLFKKSRDKKEREREATLSLRPKMIEL